jgi:hypothetical protein
MPYLSTDLTGFSLSLSLSVSLSFHTAKESCLWNVNSTILLPFLHPRPTSIYSRAQPEVPYSPTHHHSPAPCLCPILVPLPNPSLYIGNDPFFLPGAAPGDLMFPLQV